MKLCALLSYCSSCFRDITLPTRSGLCRITWFGVYHKCIYQYITISWNIIGVGLTLRVNDVFKFTANYSLWAFSYFSSKMQLKLNQRVFTGDFSLIVCDQSLLYWAVLSCYTVALALDTYRSWNICIIFCDFCNFFFYNYFNFCVDISYRTSTFLSS